MEAVVEKRSPGRPKIPRPYVRNIEPITVGAIRYETTEKGEVRERNAPGSRVVGQKVTYVDRKDRVRVLTIRGLLVTPEWAERMALQRAAGRLAVK